jgi:hypothetical protein
MYCWPLEPVNLRRTCSFTRYMLPADTIVPYWRALRPNGAVRNPQEHPARTGSGTSASQRLRVQAFWADDGDCCRRCKCVLRGHC